MPIISQRTLQQTWGCWATRRREKAESHRKRSTASYRQWKQTIWISASLCQPSLRRLKRRRRKTIACPSRSLMGKVKCSRVMGHLRVLINLSTVWSRTWWAGYPQIKVQTMIKVNKTTIITYETPFRSFRPNSQPPAMITMSWPFKRIKLRLASICLKPKAKSLVNNYNQNSRTLMLVRRSIAGSRTSSARWSASMKVSWLIVWRKWRN